MKKRNRGRRPGSGEPRRRRRRGDQPRTSPLGPAAQAAPVVQAEAKPALPPPSTEQVADARMLSRTFAQVASQLSPSVVRISITKGGGNAAQCTAAATRSRARRSSASSATTTTATRAAAAGPSSSGTRLGRGHRQEGLHPDQQPRRRGRRRRQGQLRRRQDRRPARSSAPIPRAISRWSRSTASTCSRPARRLRQAAGRRVGHRHRQSVRARPHRHRRRALGQEPLGLPGRRPLRGLPADRRVDQSRQLGRPAGQPRRRGHRHQHDDRRHRHRHRLRRAVVDGQARRRAADPDRQGAAAVPRHPHAGPDARDGQAASARTRRRRARSSVSVDSRARRPRRPASSRAT